MLLRLANIKAFCNTTSGWETEGSVSILVLIWCNGIYFPIWMLLLVILGHNWHCWVEGGRKIADSRQNKYRIEPRINCTHPKYSDQWTYDISSLRATQSISSEYYLQNLSEGFIWVRNIWAILPIKRDPIHIIQSQSFIILTMCNSHVNLVWKIRLRIIN